MISIGINLNFQETLDIIKEYYYEEKFDQKMNEHFENKLDTGSNKDKLEDCEEDVKFVSKLLNNFHHGQYKLAIHLKEKYKEYQKSLEDKLPFEKYTNNKIMKDVLENLSEIRVETYPCVGYYRKKFPNDCLFIGISLKDDAISMDKWETFTNIAKYIFKEYKNDDESSKELMIRRFIR
jgi:hypothetical protein